jgi:hypothetical protein
MAVPNQLTRLFLGSCKSHSLHDAVQPALQELQQVVTGHALHALGFFKIAAELSFKDTVNTADFLFFPELQAVFRLLYPALPVLSGRIAPPGDCAFIRKTTLRFQKKLGTFSPAELAN